MRILVTDGMDKTAMAQLREAGHEVVEQFYAPEELGAALREFDAARRPRGLPRTAAPLRSCPFHQLREYA